MPKRADEIAYRTARPIPCFWCSVLRGWVQTPCGHDYCASKAWR